MKNNPLVTVIIPIYNVEKYLNECIDSVIYQTYQNIEIILINDHSSDRSGEIADRYAKKDTRIKVIHKSKNEGLSSARNTGYKIAKGKYVQFLDSDDYFNKRLIESAVEVAERTKADIIVENYIVHDYLTNNRWVAIDRSRLPVKEIFSMDDIDSPKIGAIPYNVWSKLFLKSFLDEHNIKHDNELRRSEDVVFSYAALFKAKKIATVSNPHITYRRNLPTSNTRTNDKFPSASVLAWEKLYLFLKKNKLYNKYKYDYETAMLNSLHWHFDRLNTKKGRYELAEAANTFLGKINVSVKHDFRVIVQLILVGSKELAIFEDKNIKIKNLKEALNDARSQIQAMDTSNKNKRFINCFKNVFKAKIRQNNHKSVATNNTGKVQ